MKFYNDFNSMFNAQFGLKSDMSVFNGSPITVAFSFRSGLAPIATANLTERGISISGNEGFDADYFIPLSEFTHWLVTGGLDYAADDALKGLLIDFLNHYGDDSMPDDLMEGIWESY